MYLIPPGRFFESFIRIGLDLAGILFFSKKIVLFVCLFVCLFDFCFFLLFESSWIPLGRFPERFVKIEHDLANILST